MSGVKGLNRMVQHKHCLMAEHETRAFRGKTCHPGQTWIRVNAKQGVAALFDSLLVPYEEILGPSGYQRRC